MNIANIEIVESPFGPIQTPISLVEVSDREQGRVVFMGGWKQNPDIMRQFQISLAEQYDFSSIGLSVFDTIDPTVEEQAIGDRMKKRANIVNYLGENVLSRMFAEPSAVLTHCAGANVLLLAMNQPEVNDYFPAKRVLAEPMIVRGEDVRYYTSPFAHHGRKVKNMRKDHEHDDNSPISLISFDELHPDEREYAIGALGVRPMNDINFSDGIALLASAVESAGKAADYTIVVGEDDPGAKAEDIEQRLQAANCSVPIVPYLGQERFGHGYLLIEPNALKTIVPLLAA